MASSRLRTHQGKFICNNDGSRPTVSGLLQRVPIADQFQRLLHSLPSVPPGGGQSPFVVDNCLKLHAQPPSLSCTAAPEFMISNNETENEPPDAHEVNFHGARPGIRGSHEL